MKRSILFGMAVALAVGCDGNDGDTVDTSPVVDLGEPPVLTVDIPDGPLVAGAAVLTGTVSDLEDSPLLLRVVVSSNLDGELLRGPPAGDGSWRFEGAMSSGQHQIQVTATDSDGLTDAVGISVNVRENHPPACRILEPTEGAVFAVSAPVRLTGEAPDPDGDEVQMLWYAITDAGSTGLFQGTTFEWRFTKVGIKDIKLVADDDFGGVCEDVVRITIE